MPNLTLSVSEEIKKEMDKHKLINWSAVARESIKEKLSQLAILDAIASKSKLTESDALKLGRKIKKSMWEKYKEKGW